MSSSSVPAKSSLQLLKEQEKALLEAIEQQQTIINEAKTGRRSVKTGKVIKSANMTIMNKYKALDLVQSQIEIQEVNQVVSEKPSASTEASLSPPPAPTTHTSISPSPVPVPTAPSSLAQSSPSPAAVPTNYVPATSGHPQLTSYQSSEDDEYQPYTGTERYVEIDSSNEEMKLLTPDTQAKLFKNMKKRVHDESSSSEEDVKDTKKGKAKAKPKHWSKKAKSEPKQHTTEEGIEILTIWLNTMVFEKPDIPTSLKNQVRKNPQFLPEAYTTTKELTLEMLTNESGNTVCIHHDLKDRVTAHVDGGQSIADIQIHGVPVPRMMKTKKNPGKQVEGHFSCGCAIETAVVGAVLWKSWEVSSIIQENSITEGFGSQPLNPRNTLFILQNLDRIWGIKISDLLTGTIGNKKEGGKK